MSWQPYTAEKEYEWRYLGTSPIKNTRLPKGVMKLKLEKEGFKTKFLVDANPSFLFDNHPIDLGWELPAIQMYTEKTIPEGMVPIDGGRFIPALIGEGVTEYNLSTYYIDKYEVTNKQFKEFVDAKGYEIFQYWTDMEFILEGESLSWEEAKELMIDSTELQDQQVGSLVLIEMVKKIFLLQELVGMKLKLMQDLKAIYYRLCITGQKQLFHLLKSGLQYLLFF